MKNKRKHTLETGRLVLCHFELSDAEAMFQNWANNPDVVRFLPCDVSYTLEDTYIQKRVPQKPVIKSEKHGGGKAILSKRSRQ